MQKAMAAIAAAFDAATGALTTEPSATFDVPGDLGPLPPSPPGSASTVETAGTAPAGWPSLPSAVAPAVSPMTAPASPFPAAQDPVAAPMPTVAMPAPVPAAAPAGATAPAMPTMPSLGDLGGGLTGGAGGLAGLGQQIADAIGGLLDQPDDALPDPPDVKDDPADDEPSPSPDEEDPAAADDKPDESDEKPDDPAATTGDVGEVEEDTCTGEPVVESSSEEEPAPTPPPEPMPSPPPIVEPQPAQELAGAQTPCEIAADELPQRPARASLVAQPNLDLFVGLHFGNVLGDALCAERGFARAYRTSVSSLPRNCRTDVLRSSAGAALHASWLRRLPAAPIFDHLAPMSVPVPLRPLRRRLHRRRNDLGSDCGSRRIRLHSRHRP